MHGNSGYGVSTDAFSCLQIFQVARSRSHSNMSDLASPSSHLSMQLLLSPYGLGVEGVSVLPSESILAFGVAGAVVCPALVAGLGLVAQ